MEDVDGWIVSGGAQRPRKDNVAIQHGAYGVADRFVEVVALHQHREESGDGAVPEISRALKNLGKQAEHRRRIAFLTGRLSRRETDLTLRHGEACHRIHHHQDARTLVAETFSNSERHKTSAQADRRRAVGGGDHHNRLAHAIGSQFVIEKRTHFAVALTDERDYADVGRTMPRHGAQQRALAHATTAEDSDSLTPAAREKSVDGTK